MAESWLLRGPAESALRLLGEAFKRGSIVNGQVRKNLAIQFYSCCLQSMNKLAVAQPVQLGRSADAHNPQRAVLALFLFSSRVGELQGAVYGFFRRTVQLGFCQEITAGAVKYLLAFSATFRPAFYTR